MKCNSRKYLTVDTFPSILGDDHEEAAAEVAAVAVAVAVAVAAARQDRNCEDPGSFDRQWLYISQM